MKRRFKWLAVLLVYLQLATPCWAVRELGDYTPGKNVRFNFNTYDPDTGAPITLAGTPSLTVYKDSGTTQDAGDITLSVDFDAVTGLHNVAIDTSVDPTFYSAGSNYSVQIAAGTVDGVSAVGTEVASFSLTNRSHLRPTTADRTLAVEADGMAHSDLKELLGTAPVPHTAGWFPATVKDGTGTGEIDTSSGTVTSTLSTASQWQIAVKALAAARGYKNIWFVSAAGNDANAGTSPADAELTCAAGRGDAAAGDLIVVLPGPYAAETAILPKQKVDWYFAPGAIVDASGSSFIGIFSNEADASVLEYNVFGYGQFIHNGENPVANYQANAKIYIECESATVTPGAGIVVYADAASSGTVIVKVRRNVSATGSGGTALANSGTGHVLLECPTISCNTLLQLGSSSSSVVTIKTDRATYSDTGAITGTAGTVALEGIFQGTHASSTGITTAAGITILANSGASLVPTGRPPFTGAGPILVGDDFAFNRVTTTATNILPSKSEKVYTKLPSNPYLTGTGASDGDIQLNEATGVLPAASIASTTFATGAINDTAIADAAIGSSELATDALTSNELASSFLAEFLTVDTGQTVAAAGSVGKISQGAAGFTADDVATAVRDKAVAGAAANSMGQHISRIPNFAPGVAGGLPTVDATNRIAGIAGTITTLDALDTAQDTQHTTTHGRLPAALVGGKMDSSVSDFTVEGVADLFTVNSGVNYDLASQGSILGEFQQYFDAVVVASLTSTVSADIVEYKGTAVPDLVNGFFPATVSAYGSGLVPLQTGGTIGSVTGSVGSVAGNVSGSVGSVVGNVGGNVVGSVGSVTGAVGSVTGNVGGSVAGSVASVTGAVGSVTGNLGGSVAGSVGSVIGTVGSVTNPVIVGTNNDKAGYSLTGAQSFNLTGNITGNLSGSVGSVTGAVGSVTGAVGSVTGNVGGNVAGSVGSVTGAVGSVTGNVGGNLAGSVGSVTGGVGGNVTGSVGSVVGGVGGSVTGSVASVTGAVGSVTGNVGGNVVGSTGSISGVAFPAGFGTLTVANIQSGLATAANLQTVDDLVDDLETRLDATRSGYLDNLSGGAVSTAAELAITKAFVDTEVLAIKTTTDILATMTQVDGADNEFKPSALEESGLSGSHGTVITNLGTALEQDGGVYRFTTNALEQGPAGGGGGTSADLLLTTTLASVTSQTQIVLSAGSTVDGAYTDLPIVLTDVSNTDYPSVRRATNYVGATRTLTLDSAPNFTMVAGDGAKVFVGTATDWTSVEQQQILAALSLEADIGVPSALMWTIKRSDGIVGSHVTIVKDPTESPIEVAADFRQVLGDSDAISSVTEVALTSTHVGDLTPLTSPAFTDTSQAEIVMGAFIRLDLNAGTDGTTYKLRIKVLTVNGKVRTGNVACKVRGG